MQLLRRKDNLSIIRIIATEYALSIGKELVFNVYKKDGNIVFISLIPYCINSFERLEIDAFTLIIYCLFEEYPNVLKMAIIINVYKLLNHLSDQELINLLNISENQYIKLKDGITDKFELITFNSFYDKKYKKDSDYFIEKLGLKKELLSEVYFNGLFK